MTKAARTRQFIIEQTAPVFNRKGYAGTSLTDITAATGLTKGSIYGNFQNKDEVAIAAFDYNYGLMSSIVRQKMAVQPNAPRKLKVYLTLYSEFSKFPSLDGGCPVLNTAVEADDTHGILREKACDAIEKWQEEILSVIAEGRKKKEIRKKFNEKEFAGALIALVEGGIMLAKVTGKNGGLKAAMKQAEKMIDDIAK
ncbi:TetR/AcrR family transcriptional regulator [uncultured Flavobacterium sp.]|uniref:TetR/AcrR family transcriptional regulator n=1 Tax=uncultured Flavobacterium sp. TaxID=165435 RepID=UPI0025D48346|nr:TetR/AcrR family transcriptional regulator [uncultured Flavobacterium sp.]